MATTPTVWKASSLVNTSDNAEQQLNSQLLALPDGGYLVVWEDHSGVHSPGSAVVAQKYDFLGNKAGGEVRISQSNVDGTEPSVTLLSNGNIAVAFADDDGASGDANLYVRVFNSNLGLVRTDTIDVSTAHTIHPEITALADGVYTIAYNVVTGGGVDYDVVARVVGGTGVVGGQFDVLNETDVSQNHQVATLSNGNFIVVLDDQVSGDNNNHDIMYAVYGTQAIAITDVVGANSINDERFPDVAALKNGGFVVVWTDEMIDGAGTGIGASVYTNAGAQVRVNFQVNTTETGNQSSASVVALADGGFVVMWEHDAQSAVLAQRFDSGGDPIGSEFTVRAGGLDAAQATLLKDGRIAFAMDGFDFTGDEDVFTAIFDPRGATINGTSGDDLLTSRREGGTVNGKGGDDELFGFEGKDKLNGGNGKDTLEGGKAKDILTGGNQRDILTGGDGRDFFDFNKISESKTGASRRDQITDFERGKDHIDLKTIDAKNGVSGNNKFEFIGRDDFSDTKGELRFKDLGSKVIVQGDVNGDGKADFEIMVKAGALGAGDFVL
ncbi:MAG: calcium-binding protein [Methyloceanibacter sp.]|uniref:calcium-binding protein n=1 Tax=Methyloceanibacter sp. TaxID=1965321 RepID=UPI003D6CFD8B